MGLVAEGLAALAHAAALPCAGLRRRRSEGSPSSGCGYKSGRSSCGVTSYSMCRQIGRTRSPGTPASAHFDTPCGETVGVKMEPTAAYEPKARQTRSNGVPLVCSFIPVSINRRLIEINPQLLHGKVRPAHHQPMVEKDGMVARLKEMQGELSLEQFGALANKSAQAALKWLKGGNMKDATIHALVSHERFRGRGYTVEWVRYGTKAKDGSNELSLLAQDVARRWMELSSERQDWFRDLIFTMHFMEQRFPIMRKGRPKGEHYSGFERAVEADMRDNHKTKQKP